MKRKIQWWLTLAVCVIAAGCGQGPVVGDADKTDSNGYICGKCGFKFYTDEKVFAEFCPKCKDSYIRPVVAYVCEKDKHLTLSSTAHGSVVCEQCQEKTSVTRMPRSADLKAWGAEKETKEAVCK
jgi:hypothetical protein